VGALVHHRGGPIDLRLLCLVGRLGGIRLACSLTDSWAPKINALRKQNHDGKDALGLVLKVVGVIF